MVDKKRCSNGIGVICLTILIFSACQSSTMKEEKITSYAFRLKPGEDLREGIEKLVKEKDIKAGWVVTCAGSLTT